MQHDIYSNITYVKCSLLVSFSNQTTIFWHHYLWMAARLTFELVSQFWHQSFELQLLFNKRSCLNHKALCYILLNFRQFQLMSKDFYVSLSWNRTWQGSSIVIKCLNITYLMICSKAYSCFAAKWLGSILSHKWDCRS